MVHALHVGRILCDDAASHVGADRALDSAGIGSGATGMVGWGGPGGRSSGVRIENGNNTSYAAWARCTSSYSGLSGPETGTGAYYGSTPNAPSVSVSQSSAVIGTGYTVSAAGNACAVHGMGTEWYFGSGAPYRGRAGASTSFSDSRGSAGYYVYSAYIRCVDGAGNAGLASGTGSAGITVYVPAPSNPSYSSHTSGYYSTAGDGGFGGGYWFAGVNASGGGSSYASGYRSEVQVMNVAGIGSPWGNPGCTANASTFQTRTQAYGPGGTSGWTYGPVLPVTSLTRNNLTCGTTGSGGAL